MKIAKDGIEMVHMEKPFGLLSLLPALMDSRFNLGFSLPDVLYFREKIPENVTKYKDE